LGEVNAMMTHEPLSTSLVAVTDGLIYKIKRNDLIDFLNKNPGLHVLFKDVKFFE